jgi:Protein of unknown function (DUF3631)
VNETNSNRGEYNTEDAGFQEDPQENAQETANLATILDGMVREIQRHVILGPHYPEAVALWVLHAHGIDACDYSPRLNVRSPAAECGKSTLLKVIRAFCEVRGAKIKISTTAASYFRQVETKTKKFGKPPIMILDEIDNFFDAENRQAYAILNGGHNRETAYVDRCGSSETNYETQDFCVWAPCVLSGIGEFRGSSHQIEALRSRCLVINLKKRTKDERIETFGRAAQARCVELGRQAATWCAKLTDDFADIVPETPTWLINRPKDSWQTLFKFADAAGPWAALARAAAKAMNGDVGEPSDSVKLLADIRQTFEGARTDRLPTTVLLAHLHEQTAQPWGRKNMADVTPAFQERQLAAALRPYDIHPKQFRQPNGKNLRGFARDQFEDAWARYLPGEPETAEVEPV